MVEFEENDIVISKKGIKTYSDMSGVHYRVFKFKVINWEKGYVIALKKAPILPAPKGAGILGD